MLTLSEPDYYLEDDGLHLGISVGARWLACFVPRDQLCPISRTLNSKDIHEAYASWEDIFRGAALENFRRGKLNPSGEIRIESVDIVSRC